MWNGNTKAVGDGATGGHMTMGRLAQVLATIEDSTAEGHSLAALHTWVPASRL